MTLSLERQLAIQNEFENNFLRHGEVGAGLSIWQNEKEILSLSGGVTNRETKEPWKKDTLVLIWSATKGLASACALHALEKRGHDLNETVASVWPAFGKEGKESITFLEVLSHQSGMSALKNGSLNILNHDDVIAAIEAQSPRWEPGSGHGYGPRTYGFLADEIVRRVTGKTLGEYWRQEIAEPLELDTWIGLPKEHHERVARILPPKLSGCDDGKNPFLEAMADPQSLTYAAFASPAGVAGISAMNSPAVRSASIASFGGISTASSLAKFYAMLANGGKWDRLSFFQEATLEQMKRTVIQGQDKILFLETAFAAGFMKDPVGTDGEKLRRHFGRSESAFGHPGAGGSLAFADPDSKIGFAYVMNQMESGVLPGRKALALVDALYAAEKREAV